MPKGEDMEKKDRGGLEEISLPSLLPCLKVSVPGAR